KVLLGNAGIWFLQLIIAGGFGAVIGDWNSGLGALHIHRFRQAYIPGRSPNPDFIAAFLHMPIAQLYVVVSKGAPIQGKLHFLLFSRLQTNLSEPLQLLRSTEQG